MLDQQESKKCSSVERRPYRTHIRAEVRILLGAVRLWCASFHFHTDRPLDSCLFIIRSSKRVRRPSRGTAHYRVYGPTVAQLYSVFFKERVYYKIMYVRRQERSPGRSLHYDQCVMNGRQRIMAQRACYP
jgi:hypothetical protein